MPVLRPDPPAEHRDDPVAILDDGRGAAKVFRKGPLREERIQSLHPAFLGDSVAWASRSYDEGKTEGVGAEPGASAAVPRGANLELPDADPAWSIN